MQAQFALLLTWLDVVDIENEYTSKMTDDGTEADAPVFVDVGGGNGHQCVALRRRCPCLKGQRRVVLQDLPSILEKADMIPDDCAGGVEKTGYDYLTEQPVKF